MVGWEFPPFHSGGLGVHCYELTRELGRLGHRITFVTPFEGPFHPVEGVQFRSPPRPRRGRSPPASYDLGRLTPRERRNLLERYNDWIAGLEGPGDYDLIHVHDWFGTVGSSRLARRWRIPLVMTVHSTELDRSLDHPDREIWEREMVGLRSSDLIIAVSRHLAQELQDRYGVPEEKIRVVYNAVRPSARVRHSLRAEQTVLYLGRLTLMKNVETFLRAAARVAPLVPGARFIVAGDGPEYPRLRDLAQHLGLSERVVFLGHVSDEERAVLLATASVFVLPSVVEPFGIAALEALVSGLPTIVSKTSGVAEVANAIFAVDFWDTEEFASRTAELLLYPTLRRVMGEAAREEALRDGWPERARETARVYAEALAARGRTL
jgi:glycogen(starch) synthase